MVENSRFFRQLKELSSAGEDMTGAAREIRGDAFDIGDEKDASNTLVRAQERKLSKKHEDRLRSSRLE